MNRGPLALKIAWRYLIAPKSHGAVSAISIISVVGVAVATAAIVIVLSVFNGFRYHLDARLDTLTPDVSVAPALGKTFPASDSLALVLNNLPEVEIAMPEVADNALVIADTREMPITLKGVNPEIFSQITSIDSLLLDGSAIQDYSAQDASIAVGVAQRLGIMNAGEDIFIFAPKREGRVNMANPAASFLSDSLKVSSVFRSLQTEFDENTVICDISKARELFQYDDQATSILIKVKEGQKPREVADKIRESLGENYIVKDRLQQQELNFRMVSIEKWITFILLSFILVIASFNIISTLCMIILDKGGSIHTLSHIGMSRVRVGRIFWWESILVTLVGAGAGLIVGVIVALIQEKFSLLKLAGDPDSLIIQAYPVRVEWLDLGVTLVPIMIIGLITAWISGAFAKSRIKAFL